MTEEERQRRLKRANELRTSYGLNEVSSDDSETSEDPTTDRVNRVNKLRAAYGLDEIERDNFTSLNDSIASQKEKTIEATNESDSIPAPENPVDYAGMVDRYRESKATTRSAFGDTIKAIFNDDKVADKWAETKASHENSEKLKEEMKDISGSVHNFKDNAERQHQQEKLKETKSIYDSMSDDDRALVEQAASGNTSFMSEILSSFANNGNNADGNALSSLTSEDTESQARANEAYAQQAEAKKALLAKGYTEEQITALYRYQQSLDNAKIAEEEKAAVDELYDSHPVMGQIAGSVASVATMPTSIASPVETLIAKATDTPVDPNSMFSVGLNTTNNLREGVMERRNFVVGEDENGEGGYDVFDLLYGTVMSSADSVVAATLMPDLGIGGFAAKAGSGILRRAGAKAASGILGGGLIGLESAAQTMSDITESGGTASQALTGGLVAGAFEGLFESWSIGEFNALKETGKRGVVNFLFDLSKNAGVNASEEGLTEIANIMYDTVMNGDISQYRQAINEYISQGYTEKEAKSKVIKDLTFQVLEAAGGGALQGMLMGSAGRVIGNITSGTSYKAVGEQLRKTGTDEAVTSAIDAMPQDAKAKKLLDKYRSKLGEGETLSDRQLGKLDSYAGEYLADTSVGPVFADAKTTADVEEAYQAERTRLLESGAKRSSEAISELKQQRKNALAMVSSGQLEAHNRVEGQLRTGLNAGIAYNGSYRVGEKTDKGTTSTFTVNEDGDGATLSTGEKIKSMKIAEVSRNVSLLRTDESGKKTGGVETATPIYDVTLENGETRKVPATEIHFADNSAALAAEVAHVVADNVEINAETANFIENVVPTLTGASPSAIALNMGYAFTAGRYGLSMDSIQQSAVTTLGKSVVEQLYKAGQEVRTSNISAAQDAVDAVVGAVSSGIKNKSNAAVGFRGKQYNLGSIKQDKSLTDAQKGSMIRALIISQATGVNMEFYESKVENGVRVANVDGERVTANGFYNNGKVYIDINAGMDGEGTILFTLSHELTHFIHQWSPSEFKKLEDFIMPRFAEKGVDITTLIERKMANSREAGHPISRAVAEEEVVADAMQTMLSDEKDTVINTLRDLNSENPGLFKKLKQKLDQFAESLHKFYNEMTSRGKSLSTEAKIVSQMGDEVDELRKLFAEALNTAGRNYSTAQENAGESETMRSERSEKTNLTQKELKELDDKGLEMVDGIVVGKNLARLMRAEGFQKPISVFTLYSARTENAWEKSVLEQFGDTEETRRYIDNVRTFTEQMIADGAISKYIPLGSYKYDSTGPIRSNVEYVITFDMDTSCPRTFQFLRYRDRIQAIAGRPLTYNESVNLLELMRAYKQEIPCSYCYVENKRVLMSAMYNNFFMTRRAVLSEQDDAKARTKMYGYDAKKKTLTDAAQKVFDKWRENMDYNPSIEEVWTAMATSRNSILNYLDNLRLDGLIDIEAGQVFDTSKQKKLEATVAEHFGVSSRGAKSEVSKFVGEWIYDVYAGQKHRYDVENNEDISEVDENALALHHEALGYSKSASSAKLVEDYMPYTDQLKNISDDVKAYVIGMGGIRKHSSNDFRIDYVQDYIMFYADLAMGGWTGHTYTKSTEFAKIFGRTGDRINISIAMKGNKLSEILMNEQEGASWAEAKALRKAYKDVGIMAMVTSDGQLTYALNSDWIDMCIPFHASSLDKRVWYDLRSWFDYTSKQLERFYNSKEMKLALIQKALTDAGVEFSSEGMEAELLDAAKAHGAGVDSKVASKIIQREITRLLGICRAKGVQFNGRMTAAQVQEEYDRVFQVKKLYDENGNRVKPHFLPGETVVRGVTVPGHNNDVERYRQLCREYGVHPRFDGVAVQDPQGKYVNVVDHPGYLKLVKETARTDTEQEKIKFNLDEYDEFLGMTPMEYAMKALKDFAGVGGYDKYDEDLFGIVPKFVEEYLGKDRPIGWLSEATQIDADELAESERKNFVPRDLPEWAYDDSTRNSDRLTSFASEEGDAARPPESRYSDRDYFHDGTDIESHPLISTVAETIKAASTHFSTSYLEKLYAEHPEYDYIERIQNKDKKAKVELQALVDSVDSAKLLEDLRWYVVEGHRDIPVKKSIGSFTFTDYISYKKTHTTGIKTFRTMIDNRINQLNDIGGTKLNVKNNSRPSVDEVERMFRTLNSNADVGRLADKVFPIAKKLGLTVVITDSYSDKAKHGNSSNLGFYLGNASTETDSTGLVVYRTNYLNNNGMTDQQKASTLLHEMIHACTVAGYYSYRAKSFMNRGGIMAKLPQEARQAYYNISYLYNALMHMSGEKAATLRKQYGMKDEMEFIAELANPDFREKLLNISAESLDDVIHSAFTFAELFDIPDDGSAGTVALIAIDKILDGFDRGVYDTFSQSRVVQTIPIKYSDRDYMSAVESGDMETAQRMVDEAARAAGYNYHLYHGTNAQFTVFNTTENGGKTGKGEGYGIYLASSKEIADAYGSRVIDSYVKFNRLAYGDKKTITLLELTKLVKASCEQQAQESVDNKEYDSVNEAILDTWVSNYVYTYGYSSMSTVFSDVAKTIFNSNSNDGDIINEVMAASGNHYSYKNANKFYNELLTPVLGIDGFVYKWSTSDVYLAFNSSQIKSADPVTYDDNGEVIPLSKRFDSGNEDIRWSTREDVIDSNGNHYGNSLRDSEGRTLTTAQQEYFADSKIRDEDGNLLVVYHGTGERFTVFDVSQGRPDADIQGLFFTPDETDAAGYGDKVGAYYLNITNPADFMTGYNAFKKFRAEDNSGVKAREYLISLGYDGVNNGDEYIAFYPEQVKEVDNLNPTDDPDVRYSERTADVREDEEEDVLFRELAYLASKGALATDDASISRTIDKVKQRVKAERAENARTISQLRQLLAAQGKPSDGKIFTKTSINDIVSRLKRDYNLDANSNELYDRLTDYFGWLVDEVSDISGSDKATADTLAAEYDFVIARALETALWAGTEGTQASQLARDIYDAYWDAVPVKTVQDRNDAAIAALKAKHKEQMKQLRADRDSKLAKQAEEYRARLDTLRAEKNAKYDEDTAALRDYYHAMMSDIRARRDEAMDEYKAQVKRERQRNWDRKRKNDTLGKIQRKVTRLSELLINPTDTRHIPEELRVAVTEFCDTINSGGLFNYKKMDRLGDAFNNIRNMTDEMNDGSGIDSLMEPEMVDRIMALKEMLDSRSIRDLSADELDEVWQITRYIDKVVSDANKMFSENIKETLSELRESTYTEIASLRPNLTRFKTAMQTGLMKPVQFFDMVGSKTLKRLYTNIRNGELRWAEVVSEASEKFHEVAKQYNYSAWKDGKVTFKPNADSAEVEMSVEEALSIYATWKRDQGKEHLLKGGFILEEEAEKRLNKVLGKLKKGQRQTLRVEGLNIRLDETGLEALGSALTAEQKGYADSLIDFMSGRMASLGNEVTMKMFGIKKFREKTYFPLRSSQNFVYSRGGSMQEVDNRIKNMSMTKKTTPRANNPVNIGKFTEIVMGHCSDMGLYYGLAIPLEDFNRVYNYRFTDDAGNQGSIKQALDNAFGTRANSYIKQLQSDINGAQRRDSGATFVNKMIAKSKKNAVFGSLSVAVQQPSAIARSMMYIDPKYLAKTTFSKRDYDEVKKYAPVAVIKEMGYFDTGVGRTATDWMTQESPQGWHKLTEFVKDGSYRDEVLSKFPSLMDEVTWAHIWAATKAEVTDAISKGKTLEGTDLEGIKPGTEEFYKACADRFTFVVDRTQVYDSVFSRSEWMRSKDTGASVATAFMAEPLTTLNMLYSAAVSKDKGKIGRAVGAFAAATLLNAILKSIITTMRHRKKDDDETLLEQYVGEVTGNFIDDIFIGNMIPYVGTVVDLIKGYDSERMDTQVLSNFVDVFTAFRDDKPLSEVVDALANAVGVAIGVPYSNIKKDVTGVVNTVLSVAEGTAFGTTGKGVGTAVVDALKESNPLGGWKTGERTYDNLLDAYFSGDSKRVSKYREKIGDLDKAKVTKQIKERYLAGEISRTQAKNALMVLSGKSNKEADTYLKKQDEKSDE